MISHIRYEILPKQRETYYKYCKILQWGRQHPVSFIETFMNIQLLDHQRYVFLSSWVPSVVVWLMSRSSGKMTTLDTPIYAVKENGPKTIGDLKVGDLIYNENGEPVEVIHLNPIVFDDVYKVEFEDGDIIECGREHLWYVFDKKYNEWTIIDSEFIYDNSKKYKNRFGVPVAKINDECKNEYVKNIVNITKTGKKKFMRCITVSGKTGLYLTGNKKTITHNSYLTSPFIMARSLLIPNHNTYCMAPAGTQAQLTFQKLEDLAKGNIASVLGVSSFFLDECVRQNAKADPFTHSKQSYTVTLYNGSTINTLNSVAKNIVGVR